MEFVKREVVFVHSLPLNVVIDVVGWIYFLAWSISFYPQVRLWHTCNRMHYGYRLLTSLT